MIYFNGVDSLIESIYLQEKLDDKVGMSDIFINPTGHIDYLVGRTVILTKPGIPIDVLLKNKNKLISRVDYDNTSIKLQPYIKRIDFSVMWNGEILDWDGNEINPVMKKGILYFPKLKNIPNEELADEKGNLTALGWVQWQVGEGSTLDMIKTKKVRW